MADTNERLCDFIRDATGYTLGESQLASIAAIVNEGLAKERDEADTQAGRLLRQNESLEEEARKRRAWLADAKGRAGYDQNTSFDVVWKDALSALWYKKAQPPSIDFMPSMDHGMRTAPEYALKHVPESLAGLRLNLRRLSTWLNKYELRAKLKDADLWSKDVDAAPLRDPFLAKTKDDGLVLVRRKDGYWCIAGTSMPVTIVEWRHV